MANTNLIVAIVFAGLFGAAVVWLAIYYLHRYIHMKCLKLAHWFHLLIKPEPEDYGHEKGRSNAGSSSRSRSMRRGRSKREYSQSRRRCQKGSPQPRTRGWTEDFEREIERRPPPARRSGQGYYPPRIGWHTQEQESIESSFAEPIAPPPVAGPNPAPQIPLSMPALRPGPVAYDSRYIQPYVEEYEAEERQQEGPDETEPSLVQPVPVKMDYMHICDEYPPMVLEALKQQAPSNSSSESLSSSDSSGSVQQIPRAYIPRSAPRAAFQFPQYPHLQTRLWNSGPTSYPRQWMDKLGRGGTEPVRYAPYTRMSGRRKLRNADRRLAPSNAPPCPV